MSLFRILCLAGGFLEEWEELEAENLVEALRTRSVGHACERIEVWSNDKRVAVLRPAGSESIPAERSRQQMAS